MKDKHAERPQHYLKYMPEINVKGIKLPIREMDVLKLECQNNFSINVYMLHLKKGERIVPPVHCSQDRENKEHRVNLLDFQHYYFEEEVDESDLLQLCTHFAWIKDLSHLISSQFFP